MQQPCPCFPVATVLHGSGCTAAPGAPDYAWGSEGPPQLDAELLCHLLVGVQEVVELARAVEPAAAAAAAAQPPAAEQRALTCGVPAGAAAAGQGAAGAAPVQTRFGHVLQQQAEAIRPLLRLLVSAGFDHIYSLYIYPLRADPALLSHF